MAMPEMRLTCNDSVVIAELGDEAVLLQIDSAVYYGLDSAGTRIWQLPGNAAATETIVQTLLADYDMEHDVLTGDVAAFLGRLRAKVLAQVVDG